MVRSIFHLQPENNWINDPNGPVFVDGNLHMFFQHNPSAPVWGNMTWGHAVSPDMVHWRRLAPALHPDKPYDKDGVFSGCCVLHKGLPHILYTGVYPETLCLAVGDERCERFEKHDGNPILTPGGRALRHWRDPYVWRENGIYRMLIGGTNERGYGFCEVYEGEDLRSWNRIGTFVSAEQYALPDAIWECPVIMTDGLLAVLFVSVPFIVRTFTGPYHGGKLGACEAGFADLGDSLYAPNLVRHPDGRWILFGWLRECGDKARREAQGWQGMISVPREVFVLDGRLATRPAAEMTALRMRHVLHLEAPKACAKAEAGMHCEVEARLDFRGGGRATFELLRDTNGTAVRIVYDGREITVDRGAWAGGAEETLRAMATPAELATVRIYLDGTAIEIFLNDRESFTTRAYPTTQTVGGFRLCAEDGCKMETLDVYTLTSCTATE